MDRESLAKEIAKGLIETGVEGGYDAVSCSTAGDYPSIGCSQWEGIDGRGDALLSMISGGERFIGRTYSDIENAGELEALAELLSSPEGQEAQLQMLASDCLDMYLPALEEVPTLTNPRCIIYCGIWCPTSHQVVRVFTTNRVNRGYDVNDLDVLYTLFYNEYAIAAECEDYMEGYQNRAVNTYHYCANLDLAEYGD